MALTTEQIQRLPQALRENYNATRLDLVEIDGIEITSYSTFSYYEAKTYVTSPTRSSTGAMGMLNSMATFVTPRLRISFNYMKQETYNILMQLINSKNEFTVTCLDPVTNTRKTNKMYFSPTDYPEIYQQNLKILGILNYEIELVGTNNEVENITIKYHSNKTPDETTVVTIPKNTHTVIGKDINYKDSHPNGKVFQGWGTNANGTGFKYLDNEEYLMFSSVELYAIWE